MAAVQGAAPLTVNQVTAAVDKRYNALRSMKAEFESSYKGAGIHRRESGVLWLQRPGKMRWEYQQPKEKLFVSDGKTVYFYVPGEKQARRAPLKKLDDFRSPIAFLLGRTNLKKQLDQLTFSDKEKPRDPANYVLRGVPKAMADRVDHLLLEVTASGEIRRIVIDELDGARTEFTFRNAEYNQPIAGEKFKFKPPQGVEVFETEDVAP
jgi:outer membrane lipoprotein carrier protein